MKKLQAAVAAATEIFQSLLGLDQPLEQAAQMIADTLRAGHKLLICGNGGSASDSAHFATELLCRFVHDRRPYPALSLASEGSLLTAIGNDYSFDEIFARQVQGLAQPGDVLIVLTTSGNSRNVVRALEEARRKSIRSIAFLGRDGGASQGIATVDLLVQNDSAARIQEAHKLLFHTLCEMVEEMLSDS